MRGLLVGRFQPLHAGHLSVIVEIRRRRPEEGLILGIGSAQESYTRDNPFTAGERAEMIERALAEIGLSGCSPIPIPDIHQHTQWVAYLRGLLPPFDLVYTNNPLTRLLFERDGLRVESPPLYDRTHYQGTAIRQRMMAEEKWTDLVPPSVARYLEEIQGPQRIRRIAPEEPNAGPRTRR